MLDSGRILLLVSTCLVITACGFWGNKRNTTPITPTPVAEHKRDYWLCQAQEAGDNWECAQNSRLSMKPVPAQHLILHKPDRKPLVTSDLPMPPNAPQAATDAKHTGPANAGVQTGVPASPPKSTRALKRIPLSAEPRDRPGLTNHPTDSIALSELPAHFYAVQIVAMSSMAALESFTKEHRLSGALTARVESSGKFYYVLLLGTYDTLAHAKVAAASRPGSLMNIEPWIRKLGALQAAVARAGVMTGRVDY
jgi:septal ring-binding cell division protein DamX